MCNRKTEIGLDWRNHAMTLRVSLSLRVFQGTSGPSGRCSGSVSATFGSYISISFQQLKFKLGILTILKAFLWAVLTDFRWLVPVKSGQKEKTNKQIMWDRVYCSVLMEFSCCCLTGGGLYCGQCGNQCGNDEYRWQLFILQTLCGRCLKGKGKGIWGAQGVLYIAGARKDGDAPCYFFVSCGCFVG